MLRASCSSCRLVMHVRFDIIIVRSRFDSSYKTQLSTVVYSHESPYSSNNSRVNVAVHCRVRFTDISGILTGVCCGYNVIEFPEMGVDRVEK